MRNMEDDVHSDHHFLLAAYGRSPSIQRTLQNLRDEVDEETGGSCRPTIRPVQLFEVATPPDGEKATRKRLTALHNPSYFRKVYGKVIDWILEKIVYPYTGINTFQEAEKAPDSFGERFSYYYVLGEHSERADEEERELPEPGKLGKLMAKVLS